MTVEDYKALPFDELRALHREIGALIAQRRHDELEELKHKIAVLGFSVEDLVPKKPRKKRATKTESEDVA